MKTSVKSLRNIDVSAFLDVLDTCKGNVYLVTHEGDKLNLKSQLSQLLGLTRLIENGKITEAYVICEEPEDERKLFRLSVSGEPVHTHSA